MTVARNARDKSDKFDKLIELLTSIDNRLLGIHESLRTTGRSRTDEDVEFLAIYYLHQTSGNISEVVRHLKQTGIHVRRQSLMEAKKFSRFQGEYESYRGNGPKRGFKKNGGEIDAAVE